MCTHVHEHVPKGPSLVDLILDGISLEMASQLNLHYFPTRWPNYPDLIPCDLMSSDLIPSDLMSSDLMPV